MDNEKNAPASRIEKNTSEDDDETTEVAAIDEDENASQELNGEQKGPTEDQAGDEDKDDDEGTEKEQEEADEPGDASDRDDDSVSEEKIGNTDNDDDDAGDKGIQERDDEVSQPTLDNSLKAELAAEDLSEDAEVGNVQETISGHVPKENENEEVEETDKIEEEANKDKEDNEKGEEIQEAGETEEDVTDEVARDRVEIEEPLIPVDFYYNFEEHVSQAVVVPDSGLPLNMLELKHSYGYDCKRKANLHLMDENIVIFAAGNLVQILDLKTQEQRYLRSISGCGIGAICVHPNRQFFAVGEKGHAPNINIFEYPSLKLYRILRGGTESIFASLTFSPDGELLASQGGEPDFMLTIWNWRQEKTSLRTKSFSQDVYKVSFAPELEGQLTTAGSGHIKFWKMADTFTGLKLQGELGRFGRTEISDIEGYVELPDGKVLSGAEWGNLLLWEGGLIKVEITCKGKKHCHQGPITQILLDEGELMTVGVDGCIRVWDFEAIDTADSTDESGMFEIDPMNELHVGNDVQLFSIVKSVDEENEPTIWYAQDANGGIWKLDLSFSHTSQAPGKLFTYHAGPISGCVASPLTHLAVSTGLDSTVRVYDYIQMKQIAVTQFNTGGTAIGWTPLSVDAKGSSLVVGFEDGVVRALILAKADDDHSRWHGNQGVEITLKQAFKPHNGKVTTVAFDGKGEILATGSVDGTVFFLFVSDVYDPVGFVRVPGAVKQLVWTPEKFKNKALLVVCDDGVVVEVDAPEPGNFDTSHSYEIFGLPMRKFKFKSIKSHLRHEEELERKRLEDEEKKKKDEEERKMRIERGLETESEQGDEEADQKPKTPQTEWHPYIPAEPSPILSASYSDEEGKFWLSMGEFDAGYLYECKLTSAQEQALMMPDNIDKPIKAVPVLDSGDVPIHVIKFSNSGQQVLFGMGNGQIRIQQLNESGDLDQLGAHWTLSMHDNSYGYVTSVVSSFDGNMILTTGADGNFFQYSFMSQEELEEKIKENKAKIPSARLRGYGVKQADDIDDPNAYSIEDAKQKLEHDKRLKEADHKKKEVRKKINQLRRQFRTILEQNEQLPKHIRLSRKEFEMDKEIKQELEQQFQGKKNLLRKELAWESEKLQVSLEKLRKRFKDVVECELIVVKAFSTPHEVSSFKASKLSDDFYQLKAEFERKKDKAPTKDDFTRDSIRVTIPGQRTLQGAAGSVDDSGEPRAGRKITTTLKGSMGERITNALLKVEEKKKKRAARRAQWEELYSSKPDDNYVDPLDVTAIKEAKENMGNYKLKSAADFVVPDHLRMNVEKARGSLLTIKDLIHEYKYEFNENLLALRDRKIQIIEEIRSIVTQLQDIQKKLSPDKHLPIPSVPEMQPEEMPERLLEYTKETLKKFKIDFELKKKQAQIGGHGRGGGESGGFSFGFGGGSTTASQAQASPEKQPAPASSLPAKKSARVSTAEKRVLVEKEEEEEDEMKKIVNEEDTVSPLEKEMQHIEQIRLAYQQRQLLSQIKNLTRQFDAELRLLRHEKFEQDITMKNADLRQGTLFEELVLLKEYEKTENILAERVTAKQQETMDMQVKILEVQEKIDLKKKDIEKQQEKEKVLMAAFTASLGENNKFADYLTKVFKKKVKRSKKRTTDGDESEEDSDEESSDDSDWEESDEESESEVGGFDLDVCPPGCDQKLYDDTCTLREKRLDIEEALADEKKTQDGLKKELDNLHKKTKIIESQLKTAEDDLEAFQLEKQQKLNELVVVVTLKLHQIQHITNGLLSHDLSPTLVFESNGVARLQQRIKELEHEKLQQKKHMRESRKKHVQLIKDRRLFEAKIVDMEETCSQLMVSKFGCIVDLETVETVTVNRAIEELKEKLRQTEIDCAQEIKAYNEEIASGKDKITDMIRDNTKRLNQLTMLLTEKNECSNDLDNRQGKVEGEFKGQRQTDIREKQRLIQLVQLQAQEMEALKGEILLLSRKGGHILPPAQPPLPQNSSYLPPLRP